MPVKGIQSLDFRTERSLLNNAFPGEMSSQLVDAVQSTPKVCWILQYAKSMLILYYRGLMVNLSLSSIYWWRRALDKFQPQKLKQIIPEKYGDRTELLQTMQSLSVEAGEEKLCSRWSIGATSGSSLCVLPNKTTEVPGALGRKAEEHQPGVPEPASEGHVHRGKCQIWVLGLHWPFTCLQIFSSMHSLGLVSF